MRKIVLSALASTLAFSAVAGSALAQPGYGYDNRYPQRRAYYYRHSSCRHDQRRAGNQGTALGAVSGGVLGGVLGHGVVGGLVGAGVGAVAGHEIARSRVHC